MSSLLDAAMRLFRDIHILHIKNFFGKRLWTICRWRWWGILGTMPVTPKVTGNLVMKASAIIDFSLIRVIISVLLSEQKSEPVMKCAFKKKAIWNAERKKETEMECFNPLVHSRVPCDIQGGAMTKPGAWNSTGSPTWVARAQYSRQRMQSRMLKWRPSIQPLCQMAALKCDFWFM